MSQAPTITALPQAPQPTDTKSVFDSRAFALVDSLAGLVTQINALVSWLNSNVAAVTLVSISGQAHDILATNSGSLQIHSYSGAKTATFRPDSAEALPSGGRWDIYNSGSGDLTLTEGSGVTITPPVGGTLVVPTGGAVSVIRTSANNFIVIGTTVAA